MLDKLADNFVSLTSSVADRFACQHSTTNSLTSSVALLQYKLENTLNRLAASEKALRRHKMVGDLKFIDENPSFMDFDDEDAEYFTFRRDYRQRYGDDAWTYLTFETCPTEMSIWKRTTRYTCSFLVEDE